MTSDSSILQDDAAFMLDDRTAALLLDAWQGYTALIHFIEPTGARLGPDARGSVSRHLAAAASYEFFESVDVGETVAQRAVHVADAGFRWDTVFFPIGLHTPHLSGPASLARLYENPDLADGKMPPHQAFLLAFMQMLETPRRLLNRLPAAHRRLYYRDLLGLQERSARSDRVMVSFVLKDAIAERYVPAGTLLDAGQDSGGLPRRFRLLDDVWANQATLTDVRWCRNASPSGDARIASIVYDRAAGTAWPERGVKLFAPDEHDVPVMTGRVVSSAILASTGGTRRISIKFEHVIDDPDALHVAVSCDMQWLPLTYVGFEEEQCETLVFLLEADAGAITPSPGLDGFQEAAPLLRLSRDDARAVPAVSELSMSVDNAPDVVLSTDAGTSAIDDRCFPFDQQPVLGMGFNVVAADWYGKPNGITVTLTPEWIDLPTVSFVDWYKDYKDGGNPIITANSDFKIKAAIGSRGALTPIAGSELAIFGDQSRSADAMKRDGVDIADEPAPCGESLEIELSHGLPGIPEDSADPREWPAWVRVELTDRDFLHAHYWRLISRPVGESVPNLPYTPQWKRLKVDYRCEAVKPDAQYLLEPFGYHVDDEPEPMKRLTAGDAAAGDGFGDACRLSADGALLAVGVPQRRNSDGAVYLLRRTEQGWQECQKLVPAEPECRFGSSIALNADGSVLVVGADASSVTDKASAGAAYVYRREGDGWLKTAKLTAGDAVANAHFGSAVDIAADGQTIAVGAPSSQGAGAAYVFRWIGSMWTRYRLEAEDPESTVQFGRSISLSEKGAMLAVGGNGRTAGAGQVYVFSEADGGWKEPNVETIAPANRNGETGLGGCVKLSANGARLAIGVLGDGDSETGAVYLFDLDQDGWVQQQKWTPDVGGASGSFGQSVDMSRDGTTVVIGAPGRGGSASDRGTAYSYQWQGDAWQAAQTIDAPDPAAGDMFGHSVCISADGSIMAVGATGVSVDERPDAGAVYLRERGPELFLGFESVGPGQNLTLHWQLQSPAPLATSWQYLNQDNRWAPLSATVNDGTDGLFRSGAWLATVPPDATLHANRMPDGRLWIRTQILPIWRHARPTADEGGSGYPWIRGIDTNSGIAERVIGSAGEFAEYEYPIPAETITRLVEPIDGIETVRQPWPSEGGRVAEAEAEFNARVAQRLWHRNRALTWREIKTLLLDAYPEIHDALPPTTDSDQAVGARSFNLVIIPAHGYQDNEDPLRPVFNAARLDAMARYMKAHLSPWLTLTLVNPVFRNVHVSYEIAFVPGANEAYCYETIKRALELRYMPWGTDGISPVLSGYRLDYYDVVTFIQSQPFVEKVKTLTLEPEPASRQVSVEATHGEVLILLCRAIQTRSA